jgi:hypothetical protein
MTELQFLLDLLLNHKLTKDTKKLITERIGQVEQKYTQPTKPVAQIRSPLAQSPSTQALLEKHGLMDQGAVPEPTPIVAAPLPAVPAAALAANRIVGGQVNTGNGTKGPRKF